MFQDQSVTNYHGRAMAQTVSRRPVFAEAWVRYEISLCATCGHRPAGQVVCRGRCRTDRMIVHWLKTDVDRLSNGRAVAAHIISFSMHCAASLNAIVHTLDAHSHITDAI